jgi:hypothetical protein
MKKNQRWAMLAVILLISINSSAQITTLPYYEPFASNLNGWVAKTTGGNNFGWQPTAGMGGTGGVRTKLPTDSNFLSSPSVLLQAGKIYTFRFHARQDISDQRRRIVVSYNTARTRIGATQFYETLLQSSSYTTPPYLDYNPSFTVPATGNYHIIYWLANVGGASNYIFTYLDDVTIEEMVAPTVSVTSPVDGAIINENYSDSTKVQIEATAADADGSIDSVVFYQNSKRLGVDVSAPYQWSLKDVEPGNYQYKAIAFDNRDNSTTSAIVNHTVNFRDGSLAPYVQWDFENNNSAQTQGVLGWVFKANLDPNGAWRQYGNTGFHNSGCIECRQPPAGQPSFAATPAFQINAGMPYTLELLGQGQNTNNIFRVYLATSQNLSDTIQLIDTLRLTQADVYNRIVVKNFIAPGTGTYYVIIRSNYVGGFVKIKFDNIRVIGNGLNLAPVADMTKPDLSLTAAQSSSLFLEAEAFDEGAIQRIEFYANNVKVGEDFTAPFNTTWANLPIGTYSVYAKPFDNNGAFAQSAPITVTVQPNQFKQSSFLGTSAIDEVRTTLVKANNDIVLIGNFGATLNTGTAIKYYIDGATDASRGAVIILSSDGKTMKSITRICPEIAEACKDRNDNFYIAAAGTGAYKINNFATAQIWKRTFTKTVHRIDAGAGTGFTVVMLASETDINDASLSGTEMHTIEIDGSTSTFISSIAANGADVAVHEPSQTLIGVGFKNFNTPSTPGAGALPVYVPVMRGFSYTGTTKYIAYDWSQDETSPRWLNKPENNMADMRFNKATIGRDGYLYVAGQVYGGNHCMRYSPFDIMVPAAMTGGDTYFNLANTGTETHIYIGRFDAGTGNVVKQQSLTARLPSTAGNSMFIEHGNIDADSSGNVYIAGSSASGMPQTIDYVPGEYSGGGMIMVLNKDMNQRKTSVRLGTNTSSASIYPINENQFVVAGYASPNAQGQSPFYATAGSLQNGYAGGSRDGYFAVINNDACTYEETLHGLATTNATDNHVAVTYDFLTSDCKAIATIFSNGTEPISDTVRAKVWIDATQNSLHVKRHYEITPYDDNGQPLTTASNKTGRVTLYFTQQEFNDLNALTVSKLPITATDATGKANLRVIKRPGVSQDGTGGLYTYTGNAVILNPNDNDIVWNATEARWEVSFDVQGFSGFFVTVLDAALPVRWLNINGKLTADNKAIINWEVSEQDVNTYTVERSADGNNYLEVTTINSKGNGTNIYQIIDDKKISGQAFFRVKQLSANGSTSYSAVVKLFTNEKDNVVLFPNPVKDIATLLVPQALVGTTAKVINAQGQVVKTIFIANKQGSIEVQTLTKGMYLLQFANGTLSRFVKQ